MTHFAADKPRLVVTHFLVIYYRLAIAWLINCSSAFRGMRTGKEVPALLRCVCPFPTPGAPRHRQLQPQDDSVPGLSPPRPHWVSCCSCVSLRAFPIATHPVSTTNDGDARNIFALLQLPLPCLAEGFSLVPTYLGTPRCLFRAAACCGGTQMAPVMLCFLPSSGTSAHSGKGKSRFLLCHHRDKPPYSPWRAQRPLVKYVVPLKPHRGVQSISAKAGVFCSTHKELHETWAGEMKAGPVSCPPANMSLVNDDDAACAEQRANGAIRGKLVTFWMMDRVASWPSSSSAGQASTRGQGDLQGARGGAESARRWVR